jgi:hypothetical protein
VGARRAGRLEYPTPNLAILRSRLRAASTEFGFRVVVVRMMRAPQGAPVVIVRVKSSPARFARNVATILSVLDPSHRAARAADASAYEGFFFGAQDTNGHPILDGFSVARLREAGQWARSKDLYPFALRA